MKGNMNGNELAAQLQRMRETYPTEECGFWIVEGPERPTSFTARVGDAADNTAVYGHGKTPTEAANDLIRKAGDRNPESQRQRKISELRDELAKLEAQQTPVVMES